MTQKEILAAVSVKLGLPKTFVTKVYKAYWRAVREHIESLPLKEEMSEEEFERLKPNVNIPSLGKLYVTPERYRKINEVCEILKQKKNAAYNRDKANI